MALVDGDTFTNAAEGIGVLVATDSEELQDVFVHVAMINAEA